MKHFIFVYIFCPLFLTATLTLAQVHVRGYYRSNGTYVQPHQRTHPNSTITDNYSYPGNYNPNTGKVTGGNSYNYGTSSTYTPSESSGSSNQYSGTYTASPSFVTIKATPTLKPEQTRYQFLYKLNKQLLSEAVLRAAPQISSTELARIPKSTMVKLSGKDFEFYRTNYMGIEGYIHFLYIDGDYQTFASHNYPHIEPESSIFEPNQTNLYGKVNVETPLKALPDYTSRTVQIIPKGSVLKISKHNDNYWRTEINGNVGFVGNAYIATTGETPEEIKTAH